MQRILAARSQSSGRPECDSGHRLGNRHPPSMTGATVSSDFREFTRLWSRRSWREWNRRVPVRWKPVRSNPNSGSLTRRQLLAAGAMGGVSLAVGCAGRNSAISDSLTEAEAGTLAALCDGIIPADDFPSASQAGAVIYIDRQLARPLHRTRILPPALTSALKSGARRDSPPALRVLPADWPCAPRLRPPAS